MFSGEVACVVRESEREFLRVEFLDWTRNASTVEAVGRRNFSVVKGPERVVFLFVGLPPKKTCVFFLFHAFF